MPIFFTLLCLILLNSYYCTMLCTFLDTYFYTYFLLYNVFIAYINIYSTILHHISFYVFTFHIYIAQFISQSYLLAPCPSKVHPNICLVNLFSYVKVPLFKTV